LKFLGLFLIKIYDGGDGLVLEWIFWGLFGICGFEEAF
jgi:hypothetical protein